jgi:hypothetical protein
VISTRGEQVAITGLLPSVFSRQPHSARTTRLTRPPLPATDREYTPARSADKHLPEAHWRSDSILSLAVTATDTTICGAFVALQRVFAGPLANRFANSATSEGADAAPPKEPSAREITEPNRSRPGVIRTHDQGIMRTRVVLVIESAKTESFVILPAKASGLVGWDEVSFCPVIVPFWSNSVGFGRTPKLSSRSPSGLRQVVSGDKFSIRREGPACSVARARQLVRLVFPSLRCRCRGSRQAAARKPRTG